MANSQISFNQGGYQQSIQKDGIVGFYAGSSLIMHPDSDITASILSFVNGGSIFVSGVETGTGMAQVIAHGLGVTPNFVMVIPVDTSGSMNAWTVVYGARTDTDVTVTVSAGATFFVFVWA